MSSSILDAIQGLATPALMQSATAALGLPDKAVNAGLGAAATSLLGGLVQKSGDASVMSAIAGLISSVPADASLLSNVGGLLTSGLPVSPANILGNKFLGALFGSNAASMISAVATASGVSTKAASGLTTLAAPLVLTALRAKLGATPTAAGLASMLTSERSTIAAAMPSSLQTLYGLVGAAAAAPVVAASVAPATKAAAPVVQPAAPAVQAPTPAAQSPAVVKTAAGPVPVSAAAPVVHTASGHASAPAVVQAAAPVKAPAPAPIAPTPNAPSAAARPAAAVVHAAPSETKSAGLGAWLGMFIPLALLTGLIWYAAYGTSGALSIASATKVVTAPAIEVAQKKVADVVQQAAPKPAAPAPAPAPVAATPTPAPAPSAPAPLVATPGANGMVVYELPGGGKIEVAKDGLEAKLLAFIGNKDAAIDKKLWFNFDRLSFVTASSDLTPESASQVASAVAILKAYPNLQVKIGGYTDNQGDPAANLKLSDTRAKRVMDQMVSSGIGAARLEAEGYGEQFPIGDNATPEGRAQNRRTALSVRQK